MKIRKILVILLTLCLVGSLITGCSSKDNSATSTSTSTTASATGAAEESNASVSIELVTSTSHLPGAATQLLQDNLTEVFGESGDNNFAFKHYNSGTLYKSTAEVGALLDGNIDVGFLQLGYLFDNGAKWANMFDIAFLYKDVDHMMSILDFEGEIGKWVQEQIWEQFHIMAISPYYLGVRDIWLRDGSLVVNTPADLKGVKIRMPNSASFLEMGAALGAEATPLDSGETYLAMKSGTVDAQENNTLQSYNNAMQEVSKSIVKTDHMITPNLVCVNGDVWESMSTEQQELFTKLVKEACLKNNEAVLTAEKEVFDKCVNEYGITIQQPDLEAFREYAMNYYLSIPANKENWNLDILDEILEAK
jgi:TRAP-type C4-dicarboxylate transport system substrate-binding protein